MKAKKVIVALLTGALLMTNGLTVFASDLDVSGGTATGSTPTSFEVDTSILGGDLVVSIPAEMTLTYDSEKEKFVDEDFVSASGRILASKKLVVKTPTNVTYKNTDDNAITVDGTIAFGVVVDADGVENWSAAELLTGLTTPVEKGITATVEKADISYIGEYSTAITYNISVVNK